MMDFLQLRRVKYYLRLTYPVSVVTVGDGFRGSFPDLPGCETVHEHPQRLYCELEAVRQEWILERVLAGDPIPLPNSHLDTAPVDVAPCPGESREATAS